MKTFKTQSGYSPGVVTKILINRSKSGYHLRKNSISIGSESGYMDSYSAKKSFDVSSPKKPTVQKQTQDYYQLYNAKRSRINNVNILLKIKSNQHQNEQQQKMKNVQIISPTHNCIKQKGSFIKFKQNIHKVNQNPKQFTFTRKNNLNNQVALRNQVKLRKMKKQLQIAYKDKLKEMLKLESKINQQKQINRISQGLNIKMLQRLNEILKQIQLEKVFLTQKQEFPVKYMLQQTSDSGSSKQIAQQYGLQNPNRS